MTNKFDLTIRTSLPKPTPIPNKILPKMSINLLFAAALKTAPLMKKTEDMKMVGFLPSLVAAFEAKKLATRADKYRDEVKSWRS